MSVAPDVRRPRRGCGDDALRRLAVRAWRADTLGFRRGRALHAFRHLGEIHRRDRQARPETARDAPARRAAHDHLHRLAAGPGELRLRVPRRETEPVPVVDFRRHRPAGGIRRRQPDPAGVPRRVAVQEPRHGRADLRRARPAADQPTGGTGLHQAVSVGAARFLERPGRQEIPRRLFRGLSRRLDPRRLVRCSPSAAPCTCTADRMRRSTRAACASAPPRSTGRWRKSTQSRSRW